MTERSAIGVDVGGTKTALGLVASDGTLRELERIRNSDVGTDEALLAAIADRCRSLADATPVGGIGVALPEVLDPSGELQSHVSVGWTRRAILDALAPIAPVSLEADVRAAALAEARLGAGRGRSTVGYVSVGTGVSAALVLDGTPYAGAHAAAQLLGSAEIPIACPHCGRRFRAAALEHVAAGPSLVARYNADAGAALERGEELLAAARNGDAIAERVVADGAETLGGYLALFVNIVDPEVVVVGGGLGAALADRWPSVVAAAREHIWAVHVRDVPIVQAELGEISGVIGAGLLIR
ncbi:MAG TPA: ROK family protein [Actinomycetota bacterium]|nr:ROK family protein [Actinomycetota bacterium]